MTRRALSDFLRRPFVIGGILLGLVVIIIWYLAFFSTEGKKLTSVIAEQQTLHQTVAADNAKVAQLSQVESKYATIKAADTRLIGYVPTTADMYTYVKTLSQAGIASGVKIASIVPATATPVTGSPFNGILVSVAVTGTYDDTLKMIQAIYALPRLTDINELNISGGGPGSRRTAQLSVSFTLEVFYQAKATSTTTSTSTSTSTSTTTTTSPSS